MWAAGQHAARQGQPLVRPGRPAAFGELAESAAWVHACMCMPASNEAAAIVSGHSLLPLQGARYVRDARSFPG